jgi:hypothetical protein
MDWTPSVFSGLVTPIHEEICSRQPFCLSYTLASIDFFTLPVDANVLPGFCHRHSLTVYLPSPWSFLATGATQQQ